MLKISEFFKRIRGIQAGELELKIAIQKAIKAHTGADVTLEAISLASDTVNLRGVSQAARSEIFMKSESIIRDVNSQNFRQKIFAVR